ncbi:MAG: hypothetical protein K6A62_03530 [Bacteroidales bacterium]|nr:hypothetical protein [Bacteroidales bacterium]
MRKTLSFYDPYGRTRLSGRKTFFFCAYHGFTIPHDIAGAILYSEVYAGANVDFGACLCQFTPSLNSFLADADWYLCALEEMGYDDLVKEFKKLNKTMSTFIKKRFAKEPYIVSVVLEKLDEILPKYPMPKPLSGKEAE